ncbi:RagB/SusD family nutrient uptake outer membrane protein [Sphingobacterium sp. SGG-5]|uniref:RagB/SusD family nutrient uptake outer membrane protein n=1 Tax=Sphingobacterium sp. SGG-5 TaxID=2710881 RepID=UPI0013ED4D1E|nr:RagB/SusD family nutrient uptake outer membrane protein [Sphingobacterium sp. SGG-5]NGM62634.1 RagB/SusD family nutrient uptake outer membrane protein [Sphingobacterium sp. SGG-5]
MRLRNFLLSVLMLSVSYSCNKYLDVVPDGIRTLESSFNMRSEAKKYLHTCYAYLPNFAGRQSNPGFFGADEMWAPESSLASYAGLNISMGMQNTNNPFLSYWAGGTHTTDLWEGISQCNVFLEHIALVPDMDVWEKDQWAAEVKFLKAYYHFLLLRAYGPIPINRENIPISASIEEVRVFREPVDEVFEYIVELMEEAEGDLPLHLINEDLEYGRITYPIVVAMKAKVLTYAASPLFNGNPDYAGFTDKNGRHLFNTVYDPNKWRRAADALKTAIDVAHEAGHELYYFQLTPQTQNISAVTKKEMDIRGAFSERWNTEILWVQSSSFTGELQGQVMPINMSRTEVYNVPSGGGTAGATMNIANMFYTANGLPINEDATWHYNERFDLRQGSTDERYYIQQGETTAALHFEREPRFYASLGFDRGKWYGRGVYDDNASFYLQMRAGEYAGQKQLNRYAIGGYYPKKLVHYETRHTAPTAFTPTNYPWPILRLSDLYLLYAEALNEVEDSPTSEIFRYLDLVRTRAGIPGVEYAWLYFSRNPNKIDSKDGLREIIQRERTIEMAFEGERFWDVRRWKTAPLELNKPIQGWDAHQSAPEGFYRVRDLFDQQFTFRDYFWPIAENDLIVNKNLVQNPGW